MNTHDIKSIFPVFQSNPDLCYLDTPASSLVPNSVIEKLKEYYTDYPVNTARGLYPLSEKATQEVENVRTKVAKFLGASSKDSIVFTRNTTESLNLLAHTIIPTLTSDEEVAITAMEHHANFVPWQQITQKYNRNLTIIPFEEDGTLSMETLASYINQNTKILSFVHTSNVLGTINDAQAIIETARNINPNIITIVDGAQSAAHIPLNVNAMDCDFFAFSGHKCFGPKGIGFLYGKQKSLENLSPFLYGGEMVSSVSKEQSLFKNIPHRFEAGTLSIGDIIAFGSALDFIQTYTKESLFEHEQALVKKAYLALNEEFKNAISFLKKPDAHHTGILSFSLKNIHPHDIAQMLAEDGICVRAGTHCAMPLHQSLPLNFHSSVRVGFSLYNDEKDIERLLTSLKTIYQRFNA